MFGFEKKDKEGIELMKAGEWGAALFHFSGLVQKNPKDVDSIIQIAKIYFRKNEIGKTKEWLLKAVSQDLNESRMTRILDMTNYRKISSDQYFNSHPVFSSDGKWIAFTSARRDVSGDGKIWLNDRPGLFMVHVETNMEIALVPDDFYNSQPAFSPEGERIVFLSAREDTNHDGKVDFSELPSLYYKEISSGKEECLVPWKYRPKFPSFSPDGNSVLFCSWYEGAKNCGVYLMDLKTKSVKSVQQTYESNYPQFSPQGDRVICSTWRTDTWKDGVIDIRDNSSIWQFELKTGKETELVLDKYSSSYAHFSPDGESLVYLSRRRDTNKDGIINSLDNSGIYVLNLKNRKEKMIVSDEHYNKFPSFSYDGKRVVFIGHWRWDKRKDAADEMEPSEYFENKGIHCVDADGENEREIVSTKHYGSRFLSASPKANLVAYISWRQDTNRGLYLAPFDRLPSKSELKTYIEQNL